MQDGLLSGCSADCCGSVHLASRETQSINSISAVEWEAREQRDVMHSLREIMVESCCTCPETEMMKTQTEAGIWGGGA